MKYTPEQHAWLKNFQEQSGFEILYPEFNMKFEDVARFNIAWLESYHCEVFHAVSTYPRTVEDFFKEDK